jgi:plastocyanin
MKKTISAAVVCAVAAFSFGLPSGCDSLALARELQPKPAAQDKTAATEVKIDNFSFAPQNLTVAVGTTVTWTNRDDIPHTVVSTDDPRAFKSKVLDTDEKFSFTFSKPGTYPYFCSVHPKMTGKVTVQ